MSEIEMIELEIELLVQDIEEDVEMLVLQATLEIERIPQCP